MKVYEQVMLIMKDLGAISKDQTNQQQGFKFRGIDQFMNALHPLLAKHGLWIIPRCISSEVEFRETIRKDQSKAVNKHVSVSMAYDFRTGGDLITVGPFPGEGLDPGDKATTKALSASYKYMCIQTFCIQTEDIIDADSETIEPSGFPAGKSTGPKSSETRDILTIAAGTTGVENYVIKVGKKYKGKRLRDVPVEELWQYANWLELQSQEKGKPLNGDAVEFISALTAFTPPSFDSQEQIPF